MKNSWKEALKLTTPIFMGYFAAGVAYGMLATNAGMPAWFTIVMSFTVISGTAQYAAIPFFVSGAGAISVFLSTLLMSLRFSFYTLNMIEHKPKSRFKGLVSIAGLTDEGFAVLSTLSKEQRESFIFKVAVLCVTYWTFSTIVGVLLGDSVANYIPHLDFALPCLFAILAYEQYKNQKQWKPVVIALIGFLLALQITETSVLLVAILIAIVIVTFLPKSFTKTEHKGAENEQQ
ncbi:AzlC family ABC transporter permease [Mannheimia varigena]|uniref:AzlC family ABC transporter permease n=1 Tax=Mannheimia varigena TaxID=85404 RepID=UPI00046D023E|nr:AzlC family ABC transporter permease [Mannheimia varigena]